MKIDYKAVVKEILDSRKENGGYSCDLLRCLRWF